MVTSVCLPILDPHHIRPQANFHVWVIAYPVDLNHIRRIAQILSTQQTAAGNHARYLAGSEGTAGESDQVYAVSGLILRLQQLRVAHGKSAAQPVLVRFVWILIRDIRLRQAVAHSGVHIIAPWEEIVQRFMESYEAVLPKMKGPVSRVR